MKIKLTQNEFALIDDEDYSLVSRYKWCVYNRDGKHKYAVTGSGLQMHRLILGLVKGDKQISHHIDSNGLNNHKVNLQIFNSNAKHLHFAHNAAKKYFTGLTDKNELRCLINNIRKNL